MLQARGRAPFRLLRLSAATLLCSVAAAQAPKLETIGALTDSAAPETVRRALEPQGTRVLLPGGPWCELWLRKSVPDGKNAAPGALHSELAMSTAVGVIRFLRPAADFRGQALGPGLYSLRYALSPNDGNHLGVSEYPDFLLVIPVANDPDPDAKLDFEELMSRSRRATGARHPGVLSLTQPSGTEFPSVSADERGHVVLQVKAKLRSGGEAPLALVVQGHAEQ